jgi:hypothetical protein
MTSSCIFHYIEISIILIGGNNMLHMVVATHGPDTCAAVVPEVTEMAKAGFQQIGTIAKKLGITVQGT